MANTEFDNYAGTYDCALDEALAVSGEDKTYFARARIAWLADCLRNMQFQPESVLDFGCGTGTATPLLFDLIGAKSLIGTDVSLKSLDVARRTHGSGRTVFLPLEQYRPSGTIDLVFCNGVFHHIPLDQRAATVECLYRSLRSGGIFAFWENNPWNPGTRYIMRQCPFDRDAITVTLPAARRLLQTSGFHPLRWDFLFIFPRILRGLRPLEPFLSAFPLGAQYQILCRKD
jgi:SAM-dependent methyltransferase